MAQGLPSVAKVQGEGVPKCVLEYLSGYRPKTVLYSMALLMKQRLAKGKSSQKAEEKRS